MNAIFNPESLLKVDQYEGTASDVWNAYIGDSKTRTDSYKQWLCSILRAHGCERVLDGAAGTGIDSEMLVEEGFEVISVDNSAEMLEKTQELKDKRKHEPRFDSWKIYQANWLCLQDDLTKVGELDKGLFDAVILLGNSFTHLPNEDGKETLQKEAIASFNQVLKPGGILIIDHRNYDVAMNGDRVSTKSPYYNGSNIETVDTYMISKNGQYTLVVLDYFINTAKSEEYNEIRNFKLYLYPIALKQMRRLLTENFKPSKLQTYGDFELYKEGDKPSYFCHVAQK